MAVSVPKRLLKRAVDRNLVKRRIREAYRRNKSELYSGLTERKISLNLVIQYQQRKIENYPAIESALLTGLSKLLEKIKEKV